MAARTEEFPAIRRYERAHFLDRIWRHWPDEHVTILGPTGSGKTSLALDLVERSATVKNPAVILVLKPEDETLDRWRDGKDYKKVTTWPHPTTIWAPKRPLGYVLQPRHRFNVDQDDAAHGLLFQRTLMDCYKRKRRIVFADEVSGLQRLKLTPELETIWERGRSMRCSLWVTSQRPTHISSHAYTQASHIFLGRVGEKRNIERYGEIAGTDEYLVRHAVKNLKRYEWLYIRQEDETMCIISA